STPPGRGAHTVPPPNASIHNVTRGCPLFLPDAGHPQFPAPSVLHLSSPPTVIHNATLLAGRYHHPLPSVESACENGVMSQGSGAQGAHEIDAGVEELRIDAIDVAAAREALRSE